MKPLALLYHRINELPPDPWTLCVSPQNFSEQMQVVRKLSPQPVITFDDGYADNLFGALPILERYEIPARFFLVSGMFNSQQEMWWDALDRLFLTNEPEFDLESDSLTERQQLYVQWFERLRKLPYRAQESELAELFSERGVERTTRPERRMLDAEEIQALAASPLAEIGAHTVTHPVLSALTPSDQESEVIASKQTLEEIIGRRLQGFAYPNGTDRDYSGATVEIVRQAGFTYAYSAFEHGRTDPFQLPRVMIRNWDGDRFAQVLASAQSLD